MEEDVEQWKKAAGKEAKGAAKACKLLALNSYGREGPFSTRVRPSEGRGLS